MATCRNLSKGVAAVSRWAGTFAITWSLCAFGSGVAAFEADPLEWRPPTTKAQFRKTLSDAEYERRSKPIASHFAQAVRDAATTIPDHGVKISGVMGPGLLEVQGVTLNDVIVAVNGEELWGRFTPDDETPIQTRVFSTKQGRFREFRGATDLGLALSVYRRPELAYLRSKNRDTRWDREAYVGLVAAPSDPDLAETAWQRALAAGAPRDRLCLAAGACLALGQGRPQTALDFWYEAEYHKDPQPLDPLLAYRVMMANFKLEQARDLARTHPNIFPDAVEGLDTLVSLHRARPAAERASAAPTLQAAGMHRRDARKELVGLSPGSEDSFVQLLTKRDVYHANPASNNYMLVHFQLARGVRDFEFRLAFTMAPTDGLRAKFVKLARLDLSGELATKEPGAAETIPIGHVELEVPSGFSFRTTDPGDDVYFPDPMVVTDGKARNSIRFVRVGGQLEVFINERRVVYQPIETKVLLQEIQFQVVGVSIEVSDFGMDELIPRL